MGRPSALAALAAVLAVTLGGCGAAPTPSATTAPPPASPTTVAPTPDAGPLPLPLAGHVVAVDPGHNRDNARHPETRRPVDAGGFLKECNTTGAVADDGYAESLFTWELAQRLADELADRGAEVRLTRDADDGWGPCVDDRGRFAAEQGATLMLSLHADGSRTPGDRGFHVITPGPLPGWTDGTEEPSADLAVAVRDALVEAGFTTSTYLGEDGIDVRTDLGTLNWARVPAVLVETHNMHDPVEGPRFREAGTQAEMAEALAAAVVSFLRE